jgi:hypothetical protein
VYEGSLASYDDLFSVQTVGTGTSTYNAVQSSTILTVGTENNARCTRTTNRYHYYLPGTSNYAAFTIGCGDGGKSNNIRRWGAFDSNDGVFFELNGTTLYAVIRTSTSGAVTETKVAQADFNADKLDGTDASGFIVDVTKVNIWWIDYQWHGAGRVRFGLFSSDGGRIIAHEFRNPNTLTSPYMRTGTLPLRTEILNTGTTSGTSSLREVCLTIYAEGNTEDYTFWRFSDINANNVSVNSGSETHLFSIRSAATVGDKHNTVVIYPETLNVYATQPVALTLWETTTLTGGAWSNNASVAQTNYSGTLSTSSAQRFKTIYVNTGVTSIDLTPYFETNDEGIHIQADGSPEVWSLTASPLAANASVTVNLGYRELW